MSKGGKAQVRWKLTRISPNGPTQGNDEAFRSEADLSRMMERLTCPSARSSSSLQRFLPGRFQKAAAPINSTDCLTV
jgi:hypothetical protein